MLLLSVCLLSCCCSALEEKQDLPSESGPVTLVLWYKLEKFIKFNEEITKREIPGIYSQPVRNRREIMEEGKENILDILRLDEILGKDPEFQLQEMSIPFSRKFKSFMQRLKEAKNFP